MVVVFFLLHHSTYQHCLAASCWKVKVKVKLRARQARPLLSLRPEKMCCGRIQCHVFCYRVVLFMLCSQRGLLGGWSVFVRIVMFFSWFNCFPITLPLALSIDLPINPPVLALHLALQILQLIPQLIPQLSHAALPYLQSIWNFRQLALHRFQASAELLSLLGYEALLGASWGERELGTTSWSELNVGSVDVGVLEKVIELKVCLRLIGTERSINRRKL
jgi:hypothetical protein